MKLGLTDTQKTVSLSTLLSTLISGGIVMGVLWGVIRPQLVLAEDLRPINTAFALILEANISGMRRTIAEYEYRRDFPPDGDWTQQDAIDLDVLRARMMASQIALGELRSQQ